MGQLEGDDGMGVSPARQDSDHPTAADGFLGFPGPTPAELEDWVEAWASRYAHVGGTPSLPPCC